MIEVLLADKPLPLLERELPTSQELSSLANLIRRGSMRERKKAMATIACLKGIPATIVAESLNVHYRTVRRDFNRYNTAGHAALLSHRKSRCSDLEGDKQLCSHYSIPHPLLTELIGLLGRWTTCIRF
jgi:transposase